MKFLLDIFTKINAFVGKLQKDHIMHAYVSTLLIFIFFVILNALHIPFYVSLTASIGIVTFIGCAKEYYIDKKLRQTVFSVEDIYADIVGICIGVLTILFGWLCL